MRKAKRIVEKSSPRVRYQSLYSVEGERSGRLWLYPNERYLFVSQAGDAFRGHWHVIDGSLLVFDHYVLTSDGGATFYSPWIKLTLIGHREPVAWSNANPFFFDPARLAFDAPKLKDRDAALLATIPHDAVVAEIGVETGTYSASILKIAQPRVFHLIDVWETIPDPWPSHAAQLKNYHDVLAMFANEIARGQVVVHKGDDVAILATFPDEYFDWVYIDTSHQYEHTLRELQACAPKMKRSGLICGHDYTDSTTSRRYGWGVIRAVNEFIGQGEWQYAWLTRSSGASFALKRRDQL